jgi:hypothetical protein
MSTYTPDRWTVVELTGPDGSIKKVFSGNYGGYCGSDTWKLSSGITEVNKYEDRYEFLNESGSLYICYKHAYGMSGYMHSIYAGWVDLITDTMSIKLDEEYDKQ